MKINIELIEQKTGLSLVKIADKIGCNKQWLTNMKKDNSLPKSIVLLYKLAVLSKTYNLKKLIIKD